MAERVLQLDDGFWNIRGEFKIAGVLDIGTQASLVRRKDGRFVLLDSYALQGEVEQEILDLTDGGQAIDAILNLHPFHTIHSRTVHKQFPHARLFGTARHQERMPDLPWQSLKTEDTDLHDAFAADFEFFVPRGVDFISENENVHFSSVMVLHAASRTLHVDDTLMYTQLPIVGGVRFHPTLKAALERRKGAATDFKCWADDLVEACCDVRHLCAAHSLTLRGGANSGASIAERVQSALDKESKTLRRHAQQFG